MMSLLLSNVVNIKNTGYHECWTHHFDICIIIGTSKSFCIVIIVSPLSSSFLHPASIFFGRLQILRPFKRKDPGKQEC